MERPFPKVCLFGVIRPVRFSLLLCGNPNSWNCVDQKDGFDIERGMAAAAGECFTELYEQTRGSC